MSKLKWTTKMCFYLPSMDTHSIFCLCAHIFWILFVWVCAFFSSIFLFTQTQNCIECGNCFHFRSKRLSPKPFFHSVPYFSFSPHQIYLLCCVLWCRTLSYMPLWIFCNFSIFTAHNFYILIYFFHFCEFHDEGTENCEKSRWIKNVEDKKTKI